MRRRAALSLLIAFALAGVAPPAAAAETGRSALPGASPIARVYGLELDARGQRERLLVFGDGPLRHHVSEEDAGTLVVELEGATLDPSAPRSLRPSRPGAIAAVRAAEIHTRSGPAVRIEVSRLPHAEAEVVLRGSTLSVAFERQETDEGGEIHLQYEDVDLSEIVPQIATATGTAFVFDDSLRGRVTIAVTDAVSRSEALEILFAALLLEDFAAVPGPGGVYKIVRIQEARAQSPWTLAPPESGSERTITTLLRLRNADAGELSGALQMLLGAGALAVPYPATNSLILSGPESRLRRFLSVARALDQERSRELVVRRLRHRSAEEVAGILDAAAGEASGARDPLVVWSDARSNALILSLPVERKEEIWSLLERLDRPPSGSGVLRVIRVRYQDPSHLVEVLRALASGTVPSVSAAPSAALAARPALTGNFAASVDSPTRSIVLRADPETADRIERLVRELDQPPDRITADVILFEVVTEASLELAVDAVVPFTDVDDPTNFALTAVNPSGTSIFVEDGGQAFGATYRRAPLILPVGELNGEPITVTVPRDTAIVTADGRQVYTRVHMRPHLRMISGEEQELFVGENVPIPTARGASSQSLSVQQNIERQDVGITLRIRPTLSTGGRVRLELEVETTQVRPSRAGPVEEVGATLGQRRLTSTVVLDEDHLAVVGFSTEIESMEAQLGVPWLRRVPILGPLLRRDTSARVKRHFVVAAKAAVQRSREEVALENIRLRLAFERGLARTRGLDVDDAEPYAVLVTTRLREDDARAIAHDLASGSSRGEVVTWEADGTPRHDVYLTGFASLPAATEAAARARARGFPSEVVVPPSDRVALH